MPGFRYAQFCPLARATEIVGNRWTLLVVRELLLGPQRFSDLRRRLAGISSSVLAERLAVLEDCGVATRNETPPPTPAAVYELTESGRALLPAVLELARWGARFLGDSRPGDHMEPDWLRLGALTFARRGPTPERSFAVHLTSDDGEVVFRVRGGEDGTAIDTSDTPTDAWLRADSPLAIMGLISGALDPREAIRGGQIEAGGSLEALDDFAKLFDMNGDGTGTGQQVSGPPNPKGN
jgi:DNA-binding HxlR family transcriptional regulator